MRPSYLLDSNVVIRFLVKDHLDHWEKAKNLFLRAEDGMCELVLAPWIVAEVVYTLCSVYRMDKKRVTEAVETLIRSAGILTMDSDIILDGLRRFREKSVSFTDALLASQAVAMKIQPATFDSDFDKFQDIRRFEP